MIIFNCLRTCNAKSCMHACTYTYIATQQQQYNTCIVSQVECHVTSFVLVYHHASYSSVSASVCDKSWDSHDSCTLVISLVWDSATGLLEVLLFSPGMPAVFSFIKWSTSQALWWQLELNMYISLQKQVCHFNKKIC